MMQFSDNLRLCAASGARAEPEASAISPRGRTEPETPRTPPERGAQKAHKARGPETVSESYHRGRRKPETPPRRERAEPETVGKPHHKAAQKSETPRNFREWYARKVRGAWGCRQFRRGESLGRPAIFVSGVHRECRKPETLGGFVVGVWGA